MKKEYLKELTEACLQNNDNECDLVQVDDTVKYLPNSIQLYINSGGLYLAEPGLTAGWLAGSLADEIWARLEILNACCRLKYSIFCFL